MSTYRYKNDFGNEVSITISEEIQHLLDDEPRFQSRILKEYKKHFDHLSQERYEALPEPESLEDYVMLREQLRHISTIIQSCTQRQRYRFLLHIVYGMTLDEIAEMDGCKRQNVHASIQKVIEKIKNNL